MSGHTPGPWHASGNGIHIRKGTVGLCVGIGHDPHEPGHCTDVAMANAHLMAAAPDLLAACEVGEKCLRDLGGYPPEVAAAVCVIIGMMQDAIKKAKVQQ